MGVGGQCLAPLTLPIVWEAGWAPELTRTGQETLVQKSGAFRIHATTCWEN